MRLPRQSTTALCVAALAVASAGGVGLAHYSEGGAFSFYKQQPAVWPATQSSQAAPVGWSYPIDGTTAQSSAQPSQIDAIFTNDTSVPAREIAAPPVQAYAPGAVEDAAAPAEEEPVVQVSRGSWSQPQVTAAAPAGDEPRQAKEAAPAVEAPPAETPPES